MPVPLLQAGEEFMMPHLCHCRWQACSIAAVQQWGALGCSLWEHAHAPRAAGALDK